jgi:murein DD-endopeptidase MepM/ murein hydrolase activator NlpD
MNPYLTMRITCDFAPRTNPITKIKEFHRGQDFVSDSGNTFAGVNGTIRLCQEIIDKKNKTWEFGKFYQISFIYHDIQFYCNIAHNKQFIMKVGDKVTPESIIGLMGSTGLSTGPHIHFEIQSYQLKACESLKKMISYYLWPDNRLFFKPTEFFKLMES